MSEAMGPALDNPLVLWVSLRDKVQQENVLKFSDVQDEFLNVLWLLDRHRVLNIVPPGMGNAEHSLEAQMSGAYRKKGSWFSELLSLILTNWTSSPLAARSDVQGFSQIHQIDVAWPIRSKPIVDPLICVETKVMGAPAHGTTKARNARDDWSNRRKELKFQATDLKLYRRQHETKIDHWDNWRKGAPPAVYFIWCARLGPSDVVANMIGELRQLTETYLDGAALFAFQESPDGNGYVAHPMTQRDRSLTVDDVVHRLANQIRDLSKAGTPPPLVPANRALPEGALPSD